MTSPPTSPDSPAVAPQLLPDVSAPVRSRSKKRLVLQGLLVAGLAVGAYYGYEWFTIGRFTVATDDAYVKADMTQLAAKLNGYITDMPVAENSAVAKGDLLVRLDAGDYRLNVAAAQARIATQQAMIENVAQQIKAQDSAMSAAQARLMSAKAQQENALTQEKRTTSLVNLKVASAQNLENAQLQKNVAAAAVAEAQAGIAASQSQIAVLQASYKQAQRLLDEYQVALEKAQHDLSFTDITAPFAGTVANRAVQPGQYVQPGTRLMALVPAAGAFIGANFKETQITAIHVGQKARITVDALPGQSFEGSVLSIAPASGAEFSLLPPENATGNFTKITQRVPVKISLPDALRGTLQPGLSVTVSVDTRDHGTSAP